LAAAVAAFAAKLFRWPLAFSVAVSVATDTSSSRLAELLKLERELLLSPLLLLLLVVLLLLALLALAAACREVVVAVAGAAGAVAAGAAACSGKACTARAAAVFRLFCVAGSSCGLSCGLPRAVRFTSDAGAPARISFTASFAACALRLASSSVQPRAFSLAAWASS
jgi:hypothetical protein